MPAKLADKTMADILLYSNRPQSETLEPVVLCLNAS